MVLSRPKREYEDIEEIGEWEDNDSPAHPLDNLIEEIGGWPEEVGW